VGVPLPKKGLMMKNTKRVDIQQIVTDQMVALIEKGGLVPWRCPWTETGDVPMPYNWNTKQSYRGINVLILWVQAALRNYSTNAWLTFNQAKRLGCSVKQGEKSVQCVFFTRVEVAKKEDEKAEPDGKNGEYVISTRKVFSLFNVEQVEGLAALPATQQRKYDDLSEVVSAIDRVAEIYCAHTGVKIQHVGDAAYYVPSVDTIRLPTSFLDGNSYAATLAHELIHSTGLSQRLDRFSQNTEAFKRKDKSYAYEELVAELGAAFVCAELGVQGQHEQHASYLDSWLSALKGDKTFLFRAAAAASKAHCFLMQGGNEQIPAVS